MDEQIPSRIAKWHDAVAFSRKPDQEEEDLLQDSSNVDTSAEANLRSFVPQVEYNTW